MAIRDDSPNHEESQALLEDGRDYQPVQDHEIDVPIPSQGRVKALLYTSHILSTFNSRAFEFGAFLFLASIYPQTLLPASVYALARAGSAAVLSPLVGKYVDRAERLRIVRLSIVGQRVAVATSCLLLWMITNYRHGSNAGLAQGLILAVLSILACVEKLSAVMNTIAVERDWVVAIAGDNEGVLRTLNSQMRRIDLLCKLVAPLLVSFVDTWSSTGAIVAVGTMTLVSLPIEYFTIARVFREIPALHKRAARDSDSTTSVGSIIASLHTIWNSTIIYFTHPAFLPSFALALLYLTVLSFSGQMITYLIALGFSSAIIGVLRGASAIFELSATWIAPRVMARLGPIRAGIWFINYQIVCVALATLCFWLPSIGSNTTTAAWLWAAGAIAAVMLSRTGLWGFDLSVQLIVQEEVEPDLRGTFSSQEFAFQNIFEMLSFASTIIFARPEQFKIPAAISAGAVGAAAILYATFVRSRRGHLLHWSRCIDRKEGRRSMIVSDDAEASSA